MHIKNLFRDIGHRLPSETTCRRTVLQLNEDELKQIRSAIHDKHFFFCAVLECILDWKTRIIFAVYCKVSLLFLYMTPDETLEQGRNA